MSHTKLPWVDGYGGGVTGPTCPTAGGPCCGGKDYKYTVISKNRETIAIIPKQENGVLEANAEFIVKACNNHYQLLEALDSIADTMAFLVNHAPLQNSYERCLREVETARQAIKDAS